MRILELELVARSLDAMREFYGVVLGLRATATTDAVVVVAGRTQLRFAAARGDETPTYHFAFNIPPNMLADAKRWLSERVALVKDAEGDDEFDSSDWNARMVYFYDPAGNIVEFIARAAIAPSSAASFDAAQILCVSEIGLVTDDVPATCDDLRARFGVGVFHTSYSDTFAALGDDDGLFIVVKRGRLWFPDRQVAAAAGPLWGMIESDGARRTLANG